MLTKTNHSRHLFLIAIAIALIGALTVGNIYQLYNTNRINHELLHIQGSIKVFVDGKLVQSIPDQLYPISYNYVMCKLFNDSTACTQVNSVFSFGAFGSPGCQTARIGTATDSNNFYSASDCSQYGIGLATDNTVPSGSTSFPQCSSYLSANSLGAVKAVTTYVSGTNTITLTATFTSSGAQSGIQKVCLFPYNDHGAAVVLNNPGTGNYAIVIDSLGTSISLVNGQSLQIQWTFNF